VPRRRRPVTVLVYRPDEAERYAGLVRGPRGAVRVAVASTPAEAEPLVPEIDALWAWKFPPGLYEKAGRLAWVQAMGAGVDSVLVPELPRHVTVTRSPGIFGPWMAEYVLGWCLWVTQRMETYREAQRERRWIGSVQPERLAGRTLVVVGLGDIGRSIARAASAAGLRVVGVSRSGRAVKGVARVYRHSALARALAEGDFLALVLPLTPETRGMIGAQAIGAMRREAWLINVGRGPLVDEDALLSALRERRIAGAILDVFAVEPLPADHPFWAMENVVVTPHVSGPDLPEAIAPVFNENLARFVAGRPLRHVVDRRRGY